MTIVTKLVFEEAVTLVAGAVANTYPAEPVKDICDRLNAKYGLGIGACEKVLTRSTIYQAQAAKDGMAGPSPKKRGPQPVIPDTFMKAITTHSQVCQVGNGELKSKQIQRLIGASILGTQYKDRFKVDSVWKNGSLVVYSVE
jgi:hypothetical protein